MTSPEKPFPAQAGPGHPPATNAELRLDFAAARMNITQLDETLRAIRADEVDALFVGAAGGDRLFTLAGSNGAYRLLVEEMAEGALTLTPEGIVLYANRHLAELLGRPLEQVIGAAIDSAFAPEAHAALQDLLARAGSGKQRAELDLLDGQGQRVPALLSVSGLAIEGLPGALCMVITDLTGQRRSEAAAQARQALLALVERQQLTEASLQASLATLRLRDSALGAISQGVLISDSRGRVTYMNQACEDIAGYSQQDLAGRSAGSVLQGPETEQRTRLALRASLAQAKPFHGEILNYRKDGKPFWNELSVTPVFNDLGVAEQFVGVMRDVTARHGAEDSIWRLAHFDTLTGLPNRALLRDRATHVLQMARRSNEPAALLFIDLDHFKNVNDSLGHDVGDRLLVALAGRLKAALRDQDTLSRMGGDEFVLLLPGTDATGAAHVAQKLVQLSQAPHQMGPYELTITPSIGIALYPSDGPDFDALARCADAAMYRAKQGGRNGFRFHTAEIEAQSARVLLLENALRRALERGQMELHYQPQKSLHDGSIVGAEALLRWHHPELGWVSPAEFIPIAESSGLILSIGEWVLRTAVQQLRRWLDAGMREITVAVNLSTVQFRQHNMPELVGRILDDAGVPAHCLELELTESVAADDPDGAVKAMNRLRELGVNMSIDDFGTGYSSLAYLKRFKVYKLKIDQSFVRGIPDDPEDQAIVAAIISLAGSLGLRTIAEGVETPAQMAYLRDQGCDEMQGYLLSRPMPSAKFAAFVAQAADADSGSSQQVLPHASADHTGVA